MPCLILDFDAEAGLLRERLRQRAARGAEASEADASVLEAQMRSAQPLGADEMDDVFRCQPLAWTAPGADGEPRADWSALLQRLAPAQR